MKKLLLLLVLASSSAMAAVDPGICDTLADTSRTMSQYRQDGATYDSVVEAFRQATAEHKELTQAQQRAVNYVNQSLAQRVFSIPLQPNPTLQRAADTKLASDLTWECLANPQQ